MLQEGMILDQYPEFRGLILGLLESRHRDTNELRIDTVILDCTHKRFIFQRYYGGEAQQQLDLLNKIAADNLRQIGDFFIRWYWKNKKGTWYAVYRYGLKRDNIPFVTMEQTNSIPYGIPFGIIERPDSIPYVELRKSVVSLWQFITEWWQTAQQGDIPLIPKTFKQSLKLLEHQCKAVENSVARPVG